MGGSDTPVDGHRFGERLQRFGLGEWYAVDDRPERMGRLVPARLGGTTVEEALAAAPSAKAITHPRVIALHAAELIPGHPARLALVTDLYDDLRSLERVMLPRAPLHEMEALNVLRELVEGIAAMAPFAHAHGWLSPSRIFLDDESHLLLANPWVGWIEECLAQARTSGTTDWEYTWVAPECLSQPGSADIVSDLFIACAIGYCLVTGKPPFDSDTVLGLGTELLPVATDPRETNPALSGRLAAILLKGLDLGRAGRYQAPTELLADIDAALRRRTPPHAGTALDQAPPPARPPSDARRSGEIARTPRRRSSDSNLAPRAERGDQSPRRPPVAVIVAGAAIALVLIVALAIALLGRPDPPPMQPPATPVQPVADRTPVEPAPAGRDDAPHRPFGLDDPDPAPVDDPPTVADPVPEPEPATPAPEPAPVLPTMEPIVLGDVALTRVPGEPADYGLRLLEARGLVYSDRDYRFPAQLPTELQGSIAVILPCDDKVRGPGAAGELVVELATPAQVFVAHSPRFGRPPAWLADWTVTDLQFPIRSGDDLRCYRRQLPAGSHVFGPNRPAGAGSGPPHYVILVRTGSTEALPDVEPPTGTVVESQPLASTDDAEELADGTMYLDSTDLELIRDPSRQGDQVVGIRFPGLAIPPGASIADARLQFTVDEIRPGGSDLVIRAHLTADAPPFGPDKGDLSDRPLTTAAVAWRAGPWPTVGAEQESPDLSPLIREVIAMPGWRAGHALALVITGSGELVAESWDGAASRAPRLSIRIATDDAPRIPDADPAPIAIAPAGPSPRELVAARDALLAAQAVRAEFVRAKPREAEALIADLDPRWRSLYAAALDARTALQSALIDHPAIARTRPRIELRPRQEAEVSAADAGGLTVRLGGGSATGRVGWILLGFEQVVALYDHVAGRDERGQAWLLCRALIDGEVPPGLEQQREDLETLLTAVDPTIPVQTDEILLLAADATPRTGQGGVEHWKRIPAPGGAVGEEVWLSSDLRTDFDRKPFEFPSTLPHLRYRFYARADTRYRLRIRAQRTVSGDKRWQHDAVVVVSDEGAAFGPEILRDAVGPGTPHAAIVQGWGYFDGWRWISGLVKEEKDKKVWEGHTDITFERTGWQLLRLHNIQGPLLVDAVWLSAIHHQLPADDFVPDAPR